MTKKIAAAAPATKITLKGSLGQKDAATQPTSKVRAVKKIASTTKIPIERAKIFFFSYQNKRRTKPAHETFVRLTVQHDACPTQYLVGDFPTMLAAGAAEAAWKKKYRIAKTPAAKPGLHMTKKAT